MQTKERIARWLDAGHRTWRWNRGETGSYDAVETTDDGLRWYRWSHDIEGEGAFDVVRQSFTEFRASGPPRPMPPSVREAVKAWVDARCTPTAS